MGKIDIEVYDEWNFKFTGEKHGKSVNSIEYQVCGYCKFTPLDKTYLYIINSLKEAGLLNESYKPICCYCKVLNRFGLSDLRNELNNLSYYILDDILCIRFSSYAVGKNNYNRSIKWENVDVRIHDWSKVKWL